MKLTKSVTYIYGKAKLTWFEEIFKEYKLYFYNLNLVFTE
ncbi:chlorohydrolase [Streptococcus pneumoniae]|nr:chlorohydrolase [Streptococcus pneumoniae]